jgi:DNA polymerase (family 10)
MSMGRRVPLPIAREVARRLVAALAPACERVEIAGSIRRGADTVGDIELVAIPLLQGRSNILNLALDELIAQFKIQRRPVYSTDRPAWGERYKKFWLIINQRWGIIQVDLFLATPSTWGAIMTIRTGPSDFSRELVTHIKYRTAYRQQDGGLTAKATGKIVATPSEEDYFRMAGMPYLPPTRRTVTELRAVLAAVQQAV